MKIRLGAIGVVAKGRGCRFPVHVVVRAYERVTPRKLECYAKTYSPSHVSNPDNENLSTYSACSLIAAFQKCRNKRPRLATSRIGPHHFK
eukprot:1130349-Amphidinium_carterae.1